MTDAQPEFAPIDPFALQQNETVRVCASAGDGTCLQGTVALVDTKNFYVSVLFDGTQYPVALPMPDWVFSTEVDVVIVPTEEGLYLDTETTEEQATIYRLAKGEWTIVTTGEKVKAEELPTLAPLRAFSPGQNFQQAPAPEPTPAAAEQPTTAEGDPA